MSVFGVVLYVGSERFSSHAIVCPSSLDQSLSVGWQHRRYGSYPDPKKDIAETLMSILTKAPKEVCTFLRQEEEDNIAADLWGGYDYEPGIDTRSDEEFTPQTDWYRTGDGDMVYCMQGQQEDYTACSSESCGHCGRCSY